MSKYPDWTLDKCMSYNLVAAVIVKVEVNLAAKIKNEN